MQKTVSGGSDSGRLETKAGAGAGDVAGMFDEFMRAFEAFKDTNDERLEALERRGAADPMVTDRLERLNTALDQHKSALDRAVLDRARPALETGATGVGGDEYKDAFAAYVKHGEEKALRIGSNPHGGYLVPTEIETEITRLLTGLSPIRAIAGVRQVSSAVYRKPVSVTGPVANWVGETAERPRTDAQRLEAINFETMELYAAPAATSAFLDDAAVDVGQWIAEEVDAAFAEQETAAFVNGDGTTQPAGFLSADLEPEEDRTWGELGYLTTGVDGAFPAADPSDLLIDLVYTLKAGYRQNATWVMNRRTQGLVRKFKDKEGNYLWQPAASASGRASLMGFDLVELEGMPDIGIDTTPIAFGDFRRGYLIVDRQGVNVLRDPFSSKPYVLFYTTKRVGGGIADYDAIKLLKFADESD